eukprot:7383871-Prymnesium_polylepis.1
MFDVEPYFDHCRTRSHKDACKVAGFSEPIPACLLRKAERKEGLLLLMGPSTPSLASTSSSASSGVTGNTILTYAVEPCDSTTLAAASSGVLVSADCAGAAQGERFRMLAETRSNVLQPARAARDAVPARGKKAAVAALAERDEVLAKYNVTIEAGVPVVRANDCKKEETTAS